MNTKQIIGITFATGMAVLAGSGCVAYRAESPYRPELVRPSEVAVKRQPFCVEEVYLTVVADPTKMLDALEKQNRGFTARINGLLNGQDFAANARAAKEEVLDRLETMKITAAVNFDVDEDSVTMPMLAFYEGFLLANEDEELEEMGLPDLKMDEDADVERIHNPQQRAMRTVGVQQFFGKDVANAGKLTARLERKYPGMFGESGEGLRVFVALWESEVSWQGHTGAGTDSDFQAGVWVFPADKPFRPEDTLPAAGCEFEGARHHGVSSIGLTGSQRTYPQAEQVKGKAQVAQDYLMDRLCAAIVEALNAMVAE